MARHEVCSRRGHNGKPMSGDSWRLCTNCEAVYQGDAGVPPPAPPQIMAPIRKPKDMSKIPNEFKTIPLPQKYRKWADL